MKVLTPKSAHVPLLIASSAILLFIILAMTILPIAGWLNRAFAQLNGIAAQVRLLQLSDADAALTAVIPPRAGEGRTKTGCAECGVIQSARLVAGKENAAAAYEITIRMRDGSIQVLSDSSAARWRPGEHTILISGGSQPVR